MIFYSFHFSSVQFSSVTQSCPTLCNPMNCSTPGLPVHHQLPEFTQTHVHRVGDAIQPSHLLSSPFPPAPNPSQHQSLFNESTLRMKWPKYWSFSFSISPSKEHPGLISFRMDWLDLLALVNLITWTTALSNSMKLSHAMWGHPRWAGHGGRSLTECGPLEKGMANHFSILALRTP